MRLVVAFVAEFESHVALQFALDDDIPFVYQWIAEVRLDAAHGNSGVQCERTDGIATRKGSREEIAIGTLRLVDTHVGAVALVARQIDGLIERHAFPAVGAAALILFTTVEDAVADAKNGLIHHPVGDADARSEVRFIPRGEVVRNVT